MKAYNKKKRYVIDVVCIGKTKRYATFEGEGKTIKVPIVTLENESWLVCHEKKLNKVLEDELKSRILGLRYEIKYFEARLKELEKEVDGTIKHI